MNFSSRKTSLSILAITSIVFSRAMFFFFNDPEGPNLLIVAVAAGILYAVTLAAYFLYPATSHNALKKLVLLIIVQILVVTAFYFALK